MSGVRGLGRAEGEWLDAARPRLDDHLQWAAWMRGHARDPRHMPSVIRTEMSPPELRWDRWDDWTHGDDRWRVPVIDTSTTTIDEATDELAGWIDAERALFRVGEHPLANWVD
jgi:hypothetical protein